MIIVVLNNTRGVSMKYCPAEVQGGARCNAPMQEVRYESVTIDVCAYDDTVVLDRGELDKIVGHILRSRGVHAERRHHGDHREHERHHASHHGHHGHGDDYHDSHGRRRHHREGFLEDMFEDWGGGGDDD